MNEKPPPRFLARKPERSQVIHAHRYLLGRDPESEAKIEALIAGCATIQELRDRLMRSAECRAQFDPTRWRPMPLDLPPDEIESEADAAALEALLARVGDAWSALGEAEPHWSVLTQDRYRADRIADNRAEFMASGEGYARLIVGMLARHGIAPADLPRAVEFGCGVGRITIPLARRFAHVTGCDISAGHLAAARAAGTEAGAANLAWWHVGPAALLPEPSWDFWTSQLVLQHNPPPLIRHILQRAFAGLAPGGVALFQVPSHMRGYRFDLAKYLAMPPRQGMEMHALPQRAVLDLAADAGLRLIELRDDTHMATGEGGRFLSHSFLFRRPR
jgi:SAM-dependent methyltransferase